MKNLKKLMVRAYGPDSGRLYTVQRGDGAFWTGEVWSPILDCAKIFREYREAGAACWAIQRSRYRGKPTRRFRVEVMVTLMGDDVGHVTNDMLAAYLADAVRIEVATSDFGDGPLDDIYLEARMRLATLREDPP